ncbi:MAG TPA: hypothetical protein VF338_03855 [Leptolinea sp.]
MSIVLGIIKGFIGNWGINVINFYFDNSLWINAIILFYALIMSICWRNYQTIKMFLIENITGHLETKVKSWSKTEISRNMKSTQIPWGDARKKIKIPILAKSGSFLPIIASEEAIMKLFPKDVLINSIRETNKK